VEDNLVKTACSRLDITQKELAKIMGVTDRTLSRYATSENIPKSVENHIKLLLEDRKKSEIIASFKESIKNIESY